MPVKMRIQVKTARKRKPPQRLRAEYKKEAQNVYRRVGMKGVINIRSEIDKRELIKSGKMRKSVGYKMTPQGVRFTVADPAPYLEKGIRKHQMRYLTKALKPIPLDAVNGIFRWATPKSMKEGKWVHPGFKRGKGFIRTAVKRTREETKGDLQRIAMKVFKPD